MAQDKIVVQQKHYYMPASSGYRIWDPLISNTQATAKLTRPFYPITVIEKLDLRNYWSFFTFPLKIPAQIWQAGVKS